MSITSLSVQRTSDAVGAASEKIAARAVPWYIALTLFLLPITASLSRWASFSPGAGYYPYFYRIFIAIIGLGSLAASLRGSKHDLPHTLSAVLVVALVVWYLFIRPPALDSSAAIQSNVGLFIQTVALFATIWFLQADVLRMYYFRIGIVVSLIIQLIIGAWEVTTGDHLPTLNGEVWLFSDFFIPIGAFVNTNNYILFLLMCLGPTAVWFLRYRRNFAAPALIVIVTWTIWMIISGQGVSGLGIITIYLFFGFYALFPKKAGTITLAGYFLFIVVNVILLWRGTTFFSLIQRVLSGDENISLAVRLATWRYNFNQFLESDGLGIGTGNMAAMYELRTRYLDQMIVENPHNTLLELLTEFGLVVALPVFLLVGYVVFNLFSGRLGRAFQGKVPEDLRLLKVEGQAVFLAWITASVIASSLLIEVTWWQFFAYQITISRIVSRRSREVKSATSPSS